MAHANPEGDPQPTATRTYSRGLLAQGLGATMWIRISSNQPGNACMEYRLFSAASFESEKIVVLAPFFFVSKSSSCP